MTFGGIFRAVASATVPSDRRPRLGFIRPKSPSRSWRPRQREFGPTEANMVLFSPEDRGGTATAAPGDCAEMNSTAASPSPGDGGRPTRFRPDIPGPSPRTHGAATMHEP